MNVGKIYFAASLLLHVLALVTPVSMLSAAPGDLDPSFGNGGTATSLISGCQLFGVGVATQNDGKIVLAGQFWQNSHWYFAVARYTTNGNLDATFGGTGIVITPSMLGYSDYAYCIALQNDGKILVGGQATGPSSQVCAVVRYTNTGAIDTSFGGGTGRVFSPFNGTCWNLAVQNDGKIVVLGNANATNNGVLLRYTGTGMLDSSFGAGTGMVNCSFGGDYGMALQSDGKIVASGSVGPNLVLARYTTAGLRDATFGDNGLSIGTTPIDLCYSVLVQPDGKILAAGSLGSGGVLARYTIMGLLDSTFGGGTGKVNLPDGLGRCLALQNDGKCVVAGTTSSSDFTVGRFLNSGALDTSFGAGAGTVKTPIGGGGGGATSLVLQSDGKMVAAGYSYSGSYAGFALARYQGETQPLLFIPGIAGSELRLNGALKWPSLFAADIRSLNLRTGARGLVATDIVRSFAPVLIYGPLVLHLTGIGGKGYTEFPLGGDPGSMTTNFQTVVQAQSNKPNFFPFPYDWRCSNSTQTETLHRYIANIRQLHGGAKVNIVAHSMGGLLLRRYILDYGSSDIDRVVTVGTPFWGAPKAIYNILNGGFFEEVLGGSAIETFDRTAEIETFSTLPGIHELLPADQYLQNGGSPVLQEDGWNINNNPSAIETYTTAEFKALMDLKASPDRPSYNNDLFHNWQGGAQDDWHADTGGVAYLHIYGLQNTDKTIAKVIARESTITTRRGQQGKHDFDSVKGPGDGTVPQLSSARLSQFWAPGTQIRQVSGDGEVEHTALMKNNTVFSMIDAFLANQAVPVALASSSSGFLAQSATTGTVATQRITVSGVNYVHVFDSFGNDNAKVSDMAAKAIPGVSITYGGGEPWVSITSNTTVELMIQGSVGEEPIEVVVIQVALDGKAMSLRRYRFDPSGHTWQAHISAATNPSVPDPVVCVDLNNNGTYEAGESILPSHICLAGSVDDKAPTVSISVSADGAAFVISLSATDNATPSPLIRYTLNDGPIQMYTGPMSISATQNVVVKAFAEDAMGNTSGLITTSVHPNLSTNRSSSAIGLSWPVADGYILEESADLSTWTASTMPITLSGANLTATVQFGSTPKKFFRLRSQPTLK